MELLLEPLRYTFMLRGLGGGLLAALACATLSAFVVWRGMSFMGDALAHSVLPGIVVAYVLGISLFWGALGAAILVVLGIGLISNRGRIGEDAAIGVVFAGFFALGILMLSKVATFSDLSHILFGNILGVSPGDLLIMAVVVTLVLAGTALSYKEILTASFDPAHASAIGLSPELVRYIILAMLALTTVVAIQTVGVVLVLALLVTPGAAASLVSRRLGRIIILSIIMSVLSTIIGFYTSYYADVASGPAIVLTLTVMFLICAIISRLVSPILGILK
jgi:ABC-type Mn2+/Zn2+ transport system permease subunit